MSKWAMILGKRLFVVGSFVLGLAIISLGGVAEQESLSEALDRILQGGHEVVDKIVALGPEAIPLLVKRLYSSEDDVAILNALVEMDFPDAVVPLLDYLAWARAPDSLQAIPVIDALGRLGDSRAASTLYELMLDPKLSPVYPELSTEVRLHLASALAKIGDREQVEAAHRLIFGLYEDTKLPCCSDDRPLMGRNYHAETLIRSLAELEDPRGMEALMEWLAAGANPHEEGWMVDALLETPTPERIEAVLGYVEQDDDPIRQVGLLDRLLDTGLPVDGERALAVLDRLERNATPEFRALEARLFRHVQALRRELRRISRQDSGPSSLREADLYSGAPTELVAKIIDLGSEQAAVALADRLVHDARGELESATIDSVLADPTSEMLEIVLRTIELLDYSPDLQIKLLEKLLGKGVSLDSSRVLTVLEDLKSRTSARMLERVERLIDEIDERNPRDQDAEQGQD